MTQTAQSEAVNLSRFCGDTTRYFSDEPWVSDGWRYATDGRVCVRVPATGEPDTPPVAADLPFPPAADLFAARPMFGPLASWPEDGIEPGLTFCWECDETGLIDTVPCPHCVAFTYGSCKKCEGRGWTGGRTCPTCGGRRLLDGKGRRVGAHLIAIRLDRLIRTLPGVRFVTGVERRWPLPFVFDGGSGLVMGMPE